MTEFDSSVDSTIDHRALNQNEEILPQHYRYNLAIGHFTDIGGGRENQDDMLIWQSPDKRINLFVILDGHGREVGKIAAESAKTALSEYFTNFHTNLISSPLQFFADAFDHTHLAIKQAFKTRLLSQRFKVIEDDEGFLLKKMPSSLAWSCVHGGTTCSIIGMIDNKIYTANVGDSTGIICSKYPILHPRQITFLGDISTPEKTDSSLHIHSTNAPSSSNTLIITSDHSPESPSEFERLRKFRPNELNPLQPALAVVYDVPNVEKTRCPPIFAIESDGSLRITNNGRYYKNVRKEWASLVSTTSRARFQDALAFTRSLGDLHLHAYGVTHQPEVHCFDLNELFQLQQKQKHLINTETEVCEEAGDSHQAPTSSSDTDDKNATTSSSSGTTTASAAALSSSADKGCVEDNGTNSPLCIVLASDGVWDNWQFEGVRDFAMHTSCIKAIIDPNNNDIHSSYHSGANRVAESFKVRNADFSKKNFGGQADNATGIFIYITPS